MTSSFEAIVVGVGCATASTHDEIVMLIHACLAEAGREPRQMAALASHIRKEHSTALARAAAHFDVPLRLLDDDELAAGVPGTAEAVAAAAGPLCLGKRKSRYATCAIAIAAPGFDVSAFGQAPRLSASIAASTLATSSAGP